MKLRYTKKLCHFLGHPVLVLDISLVIFKNKFVKCVTVNEADLLHREILCYKIYYYYYYYYYYDYDQNHHYY